MKKTIHILWLVSLLFLLPHSSAFADRMVKDQLGRQVRIPDNISRAVVLQHQTVNIMVQLGATGQISGLLSSWKKQLGANYGRLAPRLEKLPMPGDLTQVNIESLLTIKPQVVFVANYAPDEMIKQIEQTGIPVIAISLRRDLPGEENKVNPTMKDEDTAYNEGLKDGIRLIGQVMGKSKQAEALIQYTFDMRQLVGKRLQKIPTNKQVRVYIANPDLVTYGSGKYTNLMIQHAGGTNVAAKTIKGYKQVSIENVMGWNPQVIFVQDRYPSVVDQIRQDPLWQSIDAVKNKRVYLMPEYAKAWGYPMPEALALGELWMAKTLYPANFKDINLDKLVHDYYQRFYRTRYTQAPAR